MNKSLAMKNVRLRAQWAEQRAERRRQARAEAIAAAFADNPFGIITTYEDLCHEANELAKGLRNTRKQTG